MSNYWFTAAAFWLSGYATGAFLLWILCRAAHDSTAAPSGWAEGEYDDGLDAIATDGEFLFIEGEHE